MSEAHAGPGYRCTHPGYRLETAISRNNNRMWLSILGSRVPRAPE